MISPPPGLSRCWRGSPSKVRRDIARALTCRRCDVRENPGGAPPQADPLKEKLDAVMSSPDDCDSMPKSRDHTAGSDHYAARVVQLLGTSSLAFARFYRASMQPSSRTERKRMRDLLPLPLPSCDGESSDLAALVHLAVVGLNFLHAGCKFSEDALPSAGSGTSVQRAALDSIIEKCRRLEKRLAEHADLQAAGSSFEQALHSFKPDASAGYPQLVASLVDLPAQAASCDPAVHIDPKVAANIVDVGVLFPNGPPSSVSAARCTSASRTEYLALTARSLQCGRVKLLSKASSAASIFVVGKKRGTALERFGMEMRFLLVRPGRPSQGD